MPTSGFQDLDSGFLSKTALNNTLNFSLNCWKMKRTKLQHKISKFQQVPKSSYQENLFVSGDFFVLLSEDPTAVHENIIKLIRENTFLAESFFFCGLCYWINVKFWVGSRGAGLVCCFNKVHSTVQNSYWENTIFFNCLLQPWLCKVQLLKKHSIEDVAHIPCNSSERWQSYC